MFQENLSGEYIISHVGTSEGTQIKYKKGEYWYKKDNQGKEGLVEYLVSGLLTFSDLSPEEYVLYEQGTINQAAGCRSRNFLGEGQELVTFYRLYYNEFGRDLSQVLNDFATMEERIEYVVRFLQQSCKVDVTEYLRKVFTLDMLVLNEDRHLNNLAVIFDGERFRPAPIFDNGLSLLTANQSVNWHFPVEENVRRVVARPFSGSHEKMAEYFGIGFGMDIPEALLWLREEPASREQEVLIYQLQRYQHLF